MVLSLGFVGVESAFAHLDTPIGSLHVELIENELTDDELIFSGTDVDGWKSFQVFYLDRNICTRVADDNNMKDGVIYENDGNPFVVDMSIESSDWTKYFIKVRVLDNNDMTHDYEICLNPKIGYDIDLNHKNRPQAEYAEISNVSINPANHEATITWDAPNTKGIDKIKYRLVNLDTGITHTDTAILDYILAQRDGTVTFVDLDDGASYQFELQFSHKKHGVSTPDSMTFTIPANRELCDPQPIGVGHTFDPSDGTVTFTWDMPSCDVEISMQIIENFDDGSFELWDTFLGDNIEPEESRIINSVTVDGFNFDASYFFNLNFVTDSFEIIADYDFTTPKEACNPTPNVTNHSFNPSDGSATFTWDMPSCDVHVQYFIYDLIDGDSIQWNLPGDDDLINKKDSQIINSVTVDGFEIGNEYRFELDFGGDIDVNTFRLVFTP